MESPVIDFSALLGQVDVAFVVDTTSSMGPFIAAAREHIRRTADEIARAGDLDIQVAVVEFRDHPPQDATFVTRVYPFAPIDALQAVLDGLQPHGGGDQPEAVLDGVLAAGNLQWRPDADRLCFLVGDAPPHGAGSPADAWSTGCPCRATPNGIVEVLRGHRITLHAVLLSGDPFARVAFQELAEATGGRFEQAVHAAEAVAFTTGTMSATSDLIDASRAYMTASATLGTTDHATVAKHLGWSADAARGTASYLSHRGVLPVSSESEGE